MTSKDRADATKWMWTAAVAEGNRQNTQSQLEQAKTTIAYLRSQLRKANHQMEGMQAHIDNVVHPDDCNSLWQAKVADLRSQLEAAQRERDEEKRIRREAWEAFGVSIGNKDAELQAERTKREHAEQWCSMMQAAIDKADAERKEAERRLGEALAALKQARAMCSDLHGATAYDVRVFLDAVLASQTEEKKA